MKVFAIILNFIICVELVLTQQNLGSVKNFKNVEQSQIKSEPKNDAFRNVGFRPINEKQVNVYQNLEIQPANVPINNEAPKFHNYLTQNHNQHPQINRWYYSEYRTWEDKKNKDGKWERKEQINFQQFGTPPSSIVSSRFGNIQSNPNSHQLPNNFYPAAVQNIGFNTYSAHHFYKNH
ncbi:hypothetical protein PVAND_009505 [Polypedilum vanderplanki]|uniref:Uncharacterized protein n=1 Tax=Polypedilum vanderplanki TaxID=319348 RepID=A0A9J6CD44_POLVA|nr:hypothetical protein PVAND_009505 [Polypedilum vanderplanki]